MLAGWVGREAGGGALRAGGGVAVVGRRSGVLIHRALHGWVGGQRARLALDPAVSSVADGVGVLQAVGEHVSHVDLLRHLVHHTLGAVQVARALLGVGLTLVLPLGLCDLYLPHRRLLQHGLASSRGHHLECDDGWQLLSAHSDIHRSQHLALAVAHTGVRPPHLVWYEAEHVAAVAVLRHARPALLLSQHVADRGQHRSGRRAGQERRGVRRGGDGAGYIARERVRRFQGVNGRHRDRALRVCACCLDAICVPSPSTCSISSSHSCAHAWPLPSSRLLSSLRLHVFQLLSSSAHNSHLGSTAAPPALLPLRSRAHADEACPVGPAHNGGVSSPAHEIGPIVWTVNQIVLVQQAYNVMMHALLGRIAWQPIQVIGDVTIGVVVEENLSCLEAAFSGCKKQRSLLLEETQKVIDIPLCVTNDQFVSLFFYPKITKLNL